MGVKRKADLLDEQFEVAPIENWRLGQKQKVLGCEYIEHSPINPTLEEQPKNVEFEIKEQEQVWGFGLNSRFIIKGKFQYQTPPTAQAAAGEWTGVPETHKNTVIVAPNFFDKLIEGIDIFHGLNKINTSSEIPYVSNFVNTFKYATMDVNQKQLLCPQTCHPGLGVPTKKGEDGWGFADKSEWLNYAPNIFKAETPITFSYVPLDTPPFFQNSNYFAPGEVQKFVPFPILDRLLIRIKFTDQWSTIFKKKTANTNNYRFIITKISLVGEHLRLSKPFQTSILNRKGLFPYEGVTKISKFENMPNGTTQFRTRIQNVPLPEGIFVFCVKKEVLSGLEKFQTYTDTVFEPHNIQKLGFMYDNESFFTKEPNISMIDDDIIELKSYNDYLTAPPFSLNMDKTKLSLEKVKNGWKSTPYPHVYINLTNFGDKSRIIPYLNDGSILQKSADLDLLFTFHQDGSTPDVSYIIYLYYTDNNLTLDTRQKNNPFFFSPYIKLI
jgi:hypothetical protein